MSINRVVISGNLTRNPETKMTTTGSAVMTFSVAENYFAKGEKRVDYHNCVMFGDRAEKVARYLSKGSKVTVEGKVRNRSWEAQDGTKRRSTEILVDDIEFNASGRQEPPSGPVEYSGEIADEEIPF